MRIQFRTLPAAGGGTLIPRPVVDIALEGLASAPVGCLVDSGALRTRMSAEFAHLAGIDLSKGPAERFYFGRLETAGVMARVGLTVSNGAEEFSWDAPVWFCDPWPYPFGLAGLEGFLHYFTVTFRAYDEVLELAGAPA